MLLDELRVRNYRTIGTEQTLRLPSGVTLVGPNNSGKTNLLKAVELFFTGYDNSVGYRRSVDLTFGAGSQKTSLVATFTADGHSTDDEILALLDDLHQIVGTERESDTFNINLYFTGENDTAVYRVFGNAKVSVEDRPTYSRKQKALVEAVLRQFRVHYVPSAKSIGGLYSDLLRPFLAEAAYRAIAPHIEKVEAALNDVATRLNSELSAVGLTDIKSEFHLDTSSPSTMLSGINLMISDPGHTPLSEKGQGIQSTALFASFRWITAQEKEAGLTPIWLIEEPESYLHPELTKAVHEMLVTLADQSLVILTTHSLAFVPVTVNLVQGIDVDKSGRTVISDFPRHSDATQRIRQSLGVQFSDYYNLSRTNIFVEGPTDLELIEWAARLLDPDQEQFPLVAGSLIEDFGGVKQLEGFLKATFEPISRERALVSVFDGDEAGQKSRQALQSYFGQKDIRFTPNEHFVSIRSGFPIEGLFPDEWISAIYNARPNWFVSFSVDSAGELEPFRIQDVRKRAVIDALRDSGNSAVAEEAEEGTPPENGWARRWILFLRAVEVALGTQLSRLG